MLAVYFTFKYWEQPSCQRLWKAVLGLMSAILFSMVGHVWPWFLIWVLIPAALIPETVFSRWVVGVSFASTCSFPMIVTYVSPGLSWGLRYTIPTFVLYTFALLWLILVPRSWFLPDIVEDVTEEPTSNPHRWGFT